MNEHTDAGEAVRKNKSSASDDWLLNMVTIVTLANTVACAVILLTVLSGCATRADSGYSSGAEDMTPESGAPASDAEVMLGIRMEGLRLSAAGYILDFRYRVVDPAKAAPVLDSKIRPYLLDVASGAQLGVPDTAKLGQLRTKGRNKVTAEQDYFILFANPGRFVQSGNRMTLVMGDLRIENIVVQ